MLLEYKTASAIHRYTDAERHCACGYYSNRTWFNEDLVVLSRSQNIEDFCGCELICVDFRTGDEYLLAEKCSDFNDYIVVGEYLYYITDSELWRVRIDGTGREYIYRCENMTFPHATNDGRYLNWQVSGHPDKCMILDLQTGRAEEAFSKGFEKPFATADHMMICPTDPNKVFFAHEGITFYVSNRLWLWEREKGMRCIAKQRLDEDGNLGDCFGHECWNADGEGIYFVKYSCSPLPPSGICYTDTCGNQTDVLYGKYPYWHVCASPDGRFLAADTQSGDYSGVCLIDTVSGNETMISKAGYTWVHPSHPHPQFSPSGKKLIWNSIENGKLGVEVFEVTT